MHIHILGICGTFMGGIALIARDLGHTVTGSDANVYPPMSTQLEAAGIVLTQGYDDAFLSQPPDLVVIGNALSRGNPAVEAVLNTGQRYTSGPQWLAENLLANRWVLAVAGTHGKTTTSSMLAYILDQAGMNPGFLIGGVTNDFGVSARLGDSPFFVIEADEYDTAFFDKRSKFVHYHPRTVILNNLEFDHADIFADLAAIERQFHHLLRTVPGNGLILHPAEKAVFQNVLDMGVWTPAETFGLNQSADIYANLNSADGGHFTLHANNQEHQIQWQQIGAYNVSNAIAAIGAARHAGVPIQVSCDVLSGFAGVKRRQELRGEENGVAVYDDFAHHPTAIELTLSAMKAKTVGKNLIALLEPRSNTMRMGVHADRLGPSLADADHALVYAPSEIDWNVEQELANCSNCQIFRNFETLIDKALELARPGSVIVAMSNGGFGGIHQRILDKLSERANFLPSSH